MKLSYDKKMCKPYLSLVFEKFGILKQSILQALYHKTILKYTHIKIILW